MLEVISTYCSELLRLGDFNIHVDNPVSEMAASLCALLDAFGLLQNVRGSTHKRGHALDLVITC